MTNAMLEKIRTRQAVVGVVGLGYVGLPLLIEFSRAGFPVLGLDVDEKKVRDLKAGRTYIRHIPAGTIAGVFTPTGRAPAADATTDFGRIGECDAILICVPTPLTEHREPDLQFIESTARSMAPYIRAGQIVTLESTTYPGTTEDVMVPILEQGSGLKAGVD